MTEKTETSCPLARADRRLDDLHRQWHQANRAYFDPEAFRLAIQTAIQTLRTVSFILQNHKRIFANFDNWYKPWQEALGDDPLMRWMRDARNRIEKQGDLEAYSYIRAEILASYLDEGPRLEVAAELFSNPCELLKSIPQGTVGDHVCQQGILRIQRRWIENSLPNYELLDAVAIAYGRIATVVHDAHRYLGLLEPTIASIEGHESYDFVAMGGRLDD